MNLRLLQVFAPSDRQDELDRVLDEVEVVDRSTFDLKGDRCVTQILLSADRAEEVTDAIRDALDDDRAVRMLLLSVEATIPRLEVEKDEDGDEDGKEKRPVGPRGRLGREELYHDVQKGAEVTVPYLTTVALASVLAAVALVRDDPVILVGAMVVAPLLGPNLALAFATTLGDLSLAFRALKSTVLGVALALVISLGAGMLMNVDPSVGAIADRTRAGIGDITVALAAGSAGALSFTTGLPSALVGVMVAVALLPPLVNVGLLVGSGYVPAGLGAVVLVVTNVVCLNLAGILTFRLQQIRPRSWWDQDRAKRSVRVAYALWAVLLAALAAVIFFVW